MPGTNAGGQRIAKVLKEKYGNDYYQKLGALGGSVTVPKGFALMDKDRLSKVSAIGGKNSRRPKKLLT